MGLRGKSFGFRVWGLGLRAKEFRIEGVGFRVQTLGSRVKIRNLGN